MSGVVWTEANDAVIRRNWGHLSTREIGELLGRTKSAIIGRAHRIGMAKLPSPIRKKDTSNRRYYPKSIKPNERRNKPPRRMAPSATFKKCQYIAGTAKANDSCKCGNVVYYQAYCKQHYRDTHIRKVA